MNKISLLVAICAALCASVYGQAKTAPPKPPATQVNGANDKVIEAAIRTKLAKSKIGADGFTFHVQGGIVTWEGTTKVPQHKGAATRMARTAGATAVVNNIKVTSATGDPRRAQIKHSAP